MGKEKQGGATEGGFFQRMGSDTPEGRQIELFVRQAPIPMVNGNGEVVVPTGGFFYLGYDKWGNGLAVVAAEVEQEEESPEHAQQKQEWFKMVQAPNAPAIQSAGGRSMSWFVFDMTRYTYQLLGVGLQLQPVQMPAMGFFGIPQQGMMMMQQAGQAAAYQAADLMVRLGAYQGVAIKMGAK